MTPSFFICRLFVGCGCACTSIHFIQMKCIPRQSLSIALRAGWPTWDRLTHLKWCNFHKWEVRSLLIIAFQPGLNYGQYSGNGTFCKFISFVFCERETEQKQAERERPNRNMKTFFFTKQVQGIFVDSLITTTPMLVQSKTILDC